MTTTRTRPVRAHYEDHAGVSLCGADPVSLVPCPDCQAVLLKLMAVHVRYVVTKDGDCLAACGVAVGHMAGATKDPAALLVADVGRRSITLAVARELIAIEDEAPGSIEPFMCPGCAANLDRLDERIALKAARGGGRRPANGTAIAGGLDAAGRAPHEIGWSGALRPRAGASAAADMVADFESEDTWVARAARVLRGPGVGDRGRSARELARRHDRRAARRAPRSQAWALACDGDGR